MRNKDCMKVLRFDEFWEFVDEAEWYYSELNPDDGLKTVDIIAKYDEAITIIAQLIHLGYDLYDIVSFVSPEIDGYNDEYIIGLSNVGGSDGIWCEPIKRDDKYIKCESDIVYILDNCNSKVIPFCKGNEIYEVNISEMDEDYSENCDDEELYENCDDEELYENCDDEELYECEDDESDEKADNDKKKVVPMKEKCDSAFPGCHITINFGDKNVNVDKAMDEIRRDVLKLSEMIDEMCEFDRLLGW